MSEFIGSRISLISKSDIRYVGTLHQINSEDSTVALEQVKSYGTEGRRGDPDQEIAGSDSVYEYIVFRGSDVKDLRIEEPAAPKEHKPPPMPDDPAILGSGARPPNQPPQPQGFPPGGPSPSFQQRPPMPPPYQQYNQFPNQRFPGPGGPPPPQGYPGYPGPPYGHPPPGYFPPGQNFQGPPGQFPPQQQMQFPPGIAQQQRGPPQQSPQQQDVKPSGTPGSAEAPAASLQPQQSSGTPKPASQGVSPDPSAQTGQAPPPPVESKPDVATALGAPSTDPPLAAKTAPPGVKGGKITPVIPLASQATRAPGAQAPPAQANVPNPPGQAAQPQLNNLPSIPVKPQRAALMRGMLSGIHLREQRDGEVVFCHGGFDARVVAEALEEAQGARGVRQVRQRAQGQEGVGCGVVEGFDVAAGGGLCGVEALRGGARVLAGRGGFEGAVERVDFAACAA